MENPVTYIVTYIFIKFAHRFRNRNFDSATRFAPPVRFRGPILQHLMAAHQINTKNVVPVTFFATFLNAPCTALRLSQAVPGATIYFIVGKANGETIFFPTDRSECVSKFENESKVPISAIATGDLRNLSKSELVTVTASGDLTSLSFPCGSPAGPVRLFGQQLYPNICSAELLDIDGDGLVELVVVMTDRVVRSYRFVEELDRLVPLNKWEMPVHISGWAIGSGRPNFALLSQLEKKCYIRLELGHTKEVRVLKANNKQVTMADSNDHLHSHSPPTQLVIPERPIAVHLLHSMAQRILLVNDESSTEVELNHPDGADIACACSTTVQFQSVQMRIVVTIDPWGHLCVYAWTDEEKMTDRRREPSASCRVMRDADQICCCAGPRDNDDRLFIGVVNVFNRVAIFSIPIGHFF